MSQVKFDNVGKRYPNGFEAVRNLNLDVEDGELLVVVGPSGCGKTTTLRMLAGLEDITSGEVSIGDRVVNHVQARQRNIAMVFQSYALYPHLTVAGNLGYPLKLAKMPKNERIERVKLVAQQLRLEELLDRKPRQLSGGQRQRVAMGRAMVREPEVFLMDEPLSNLDAKLRVLMRAEVAELQRSLGTTMFYVTHDQVEAMTMGDRVAVMDKGVLQQVAAPSTLYNEPANLFVASFIGSPPMNLSLGRLERTQDGGATFKSGTVTQTFEADAVGASERLSSNIGRDVIVGIRPEHVNLVGDADAQVTAVVRLVEMLGSESLIHVEVEGLDVFQNDLDAEQHDVSAPQRFVIKIHEVMDLKAGTRVGLNFPAKALHVFDPPEKSAQSGDEALAS